MSSQNILQLPVAVSLDGTEYAWLVQGGTDKRATTQQISDLAAGSFVPLSREVIAGVGLGGGGALSANVTLYLDIENLGAKTTPVVADTLAMNDSATNNSVQVTAANFYKTITGLTQLGLPSSTADFIPIYRGSDGLPYKIDVSSLALPSGNVPAGGTTGQPLIKLSGTDYDMDWATLPVIGGGTGQTSFTAYAVLCGGTTSTGAVQSIAGVGTAGQVLTSNGAGALPTFQDAASSSGTVNSGTAGQMTWYAATGTAVSGNDNANISNGALTLGQVGSVIGQLKLAGNTSGTVTVTPQAAAGTPTLTLPNASGTVAVSGTSPIAVNATTGDISITGAALTKVDDTNVTLTLGGSPTDALVNAASLTLGWTGQLAVSRGGTGQTSLTAYAVLCGGTTSTGAFQNVSGVGTSGQVLTSNGAGALPSWQAAATGTVTSITPGNGLTSTLTATAPGSAITSSGTLSGAHLVNAQTGTSYTVLDGDRAKLVTFTNASPIAVTLPQAGAASEFQAGWFAWFESRGAGTVTITPTTSTVDGAATYTLRTNQGVFIASDGTNYFTSRGSGAGSFIGIQVFTASGTYTRSAGCTHAWVEVIGGGGSGGSAPNAASSQAAASGGGGGGGYAAKWITPGSTETVTVGAGGAAPSAGANDGNTGGTSSFGSHCSATGGAGGVHGVSAASSNGGAGGIGGSGSGGDINLGGESGLPAIWLASPPVILSGKGGNAARGGGGGRPGQTTFAGQAGGAGGGGGSGAASYNAGGATSGGAGGDGMVIVWEYA